MRADLSKKASLERMRMVEAGPVEELERAGHEPTTAPEEFAGRRGYDPDFLDGWSIQLPQPVGEMADDVRRLRNGGTGTELKYEHFSVLISRSRRMPLITATNINGVEARRLPRISTWSFDGRLNREDQWGDALYDQNALDRGHMVRREDPVWGTPSEAHRANVDTFHFTNSCPQMAGVNQKTWLGLEDYILSHAKVDGMRVSVFTGPFFSERDLPYRDALVPRAFWKVVAIVTDDGRPSATAYKVDQSKELSELEFVYAGYKTFQVSIQQVIDGTSIDFSPLLDYDGFSVHERATGTRMEEPIDSLEHVRI